MVFKILIVASAQRDMAEAVEYIYQESPAAAEKWYEELRQVIQTLEKMPLRFAVIPEARELKRPIRGFLYHSHRIVYEVDEAQGVVSILRVYHSARLPINRSDLEQ